MLTVYQPVPSCGTISYVCRLKAVGAYMLTVCPAMNVLALRSCLQIYLACCEECQVLSVGQVKDWGHSGTRPGELQACKGCMFLDY